MTYHNYTIRAWFKDKMVSFEIAAISVESALSDIAQAYGKPDFYQVSL